MKVLEHYCLLRSLHLSENADERKRELEAITQLALVGKTTHRLGIVGNAWKFASTFESGNTRIEYLVKAIKSYKEAYAIKTDPYDGPYLDAFSNMIFIGHLLDLEGRPDWNDVLERVTGEASDKNTKESHQKSKEKLVKFLVQFNEELDDVHPNDMDVSALLGMTEVGVCKLLLSDKKTDDIVKDITDRFSEAFKLLNSARQNRIEVAQLSFLIGQEKLAETQEQSDLKKEALEKVKESLLMYR